ncbi:MAG: hypothetical protein IT449_11605 [Phycisphaerales bacterium]|nr:hypothetical protein [Phycisphaerales bacterium]
MLTFTVFINGQPATTLDLASACLVGTDDVPLRAEFTLRNGLLTCRKRAAGPAGLVLPWDVPGQGRFLLETARLVERTKPYILQLELVRGRLIRLFQKVEEWGLHELEKAADFSRLQAQVRELMLKGMTAASDVEAAAAGDEALTACIALSEDITAAHAQALLERRRAARAMPRQWMGCGVAPDSTDAARRDPMADRFDFITLPMDWRSVEPVEQKPGFKTIDEWVAWAGQKKLGIRVSPLLSTDPAHLPDWVSAYENDFEALRDLAHDHVKRVVSRFAPRVSTWTAAAGLNAGHKLPLSFEQIMELTRMSAALIRRLAPAATVLIDIELPWGEYYASNPRSIPPALYAEMVSQSGVSFDGFGLRFSAGGSVGLRDFFQISALLDRFSGFNKPLHVTALEAPSDPPAAGGCFWHSPWDESTQGQWTRRFVEVAISKPFVEAVSYALWTDAGASRGGLCRTDGKPKPALKSLQELRSALTHAAKDK